MTCRKVVDSCASNTTCSPFQVLCTSGWRQREPSALTNRVSGWLSENAGSASRLSSTRALKRLCASLSFAPLNRWAQIARSPLPTMPEQAVFSNKCLK
ncbi:hypothetical protein PCA_12990 [Rhodanobacter sp. PCA2]|nr:hypothetical protein [Rhodanobacter sp. PCA2]